MPIVKLTFNHDWPIFRQTPGGSGKWDDYQFVIDPNLRECDFWVVFTDYNLQEEVCKCNKENIIFVPGEGRETSTHFTNEFLSQFGRIITTQREIQGPRVTYQQNANPWFVGKTYDELVSLESQQKSKRISVISSNKSTVPGHRRRLAFARRLKEALGSSIDFFGRGINDFADKWDVTAPYKFQVVIENDYCDDLVTEKFFDAILADTMPIYYGCPNLHQYIESECFLRIDIDDPERCINAIRSTISDDSIYSKFALRAAHYRLHYLNSLHFFPMIVRMLQPLDPSLPREDQVVRADSSKGLLSRFSRRLVAKLRRR